MLLSDIICDQQCHSGTIYHAPNHRVHEILVPVDQLPERGIVARAAALDEGAFIEFVHPPAVLEAGLGGFVSSAAETIAAGAKSNAPERTGGAA